MPIYEYRCSKCGKTFEALQPVSAEPIRACIHCRGRVKKIVSVSSFQLKGSGWYVSDYRKPAGGESKPKAAKSEAKRPDSNAKTN